MEMSPTKQKKPKSCCIRMCMNPTFVSITGYFTIILVLLLFLFLFVEAGDEMGSPLLDDMKVLDDVVNILPFGAMLAILFVSILLCCNIWYITSLYQMWKKDFSHRYYRTQEKSPEYVDEKPPNFIPECVTPKAYAHMKELAIKIYEAIPFHQQLDVKLEAPSLNMDNIKISFWDYIWAWYFVGPNAVLLWVYGIGGMLLREKRWFRCICCCWRRGPQQTMYKDGQCEGEIVEFSYDRLVPKLLLEAMQVIRYSGMEDVGDKKHATFTWTNLPILAIVKGEDGIPKNALERAEEFRVVISLPDKLFVSATLIQDGKEKSLTATQATTLIWQDTIIPFHVKLHAYANWAVNARNYDNSYARRASMITVMYNYFGHTIFPTLTPMWHNWGWAKQLWTDVVPLVNAGVEDGLKAHTCSKLREIAPYSNVCNFIYQLREPFLNEFKQYKDEFPEIDGDAFYIGTVMHSLDHTNMGWNMEDPLWLDTSDEEYGHIAEMGRFVRAGFVDDIPFETWHKRFRGAPHPFYKKIYELAKKINEKLADNMDTAIIK